MSLKSFFDKLREEEKKRQQEEKASLNMDMNVFKNKPANTQSSTVKATAKSGAGIGGGTSKAQINTAKNTRNTDAIDMDWGLNAKAYADMTVKPKKASVNKSADMINNDYGFNVKAMDDYLSKMKNKQNNTKAGQDVYEKTGDKIKDNKYAGTMIKIGKELSDFGKYNHLNDLYYIDNPTGIDDGYKYITKNDMNKYFYLLAQHEKGDTDKKDVDDLKHYLFGIGTKIDSKEADELPPIENKPDYSKISSDEQLIYDSYGNAVNKAKGIDYSKIPTDDQLPKEPGKIKVDKSTEAVDRDYGLDLSSYKDMTKKNKAEDNDKPKKPIDYSKISSDEQLIYDSFGNAVNKAKGIDYSKIPTDDQFTDDAKDKAIDKAKGIDYNKIYDSYGFDVSSDYDKQDKIDAEVRDYLKRSAKQVIYGNYTDDVTALGTAGQVALGLTGLDFAADIRDIVYDFSNWEWSGKHIGQTILDIIGLVPGIGVVKNIDEAAGLVKNVIKNSDLAEKTAKNVLDKVDEFMPALKRSMDSPSIAPLLGNIMKSSDEAAGVEKKVVKSGDEVSESVKGVSKSNINGFSLDDLTSVYRAVGANEYYKVMDTGKFEAIPQALQAKQFGLNKQETITFANIIPDATAVLEVKLPKKVLDEIGDFTKVDINIFKHGTLSIQPEKLDEFNKHIKEILHIY